MAGSRRVLRPRRRYWRRHCEPAEETARTPSECVSRGLAGFLRDLASAKPIGDALAASAFGVPGAAAAPPFAYGDATAIRIRCPASAVVSRFSRANGPACGSAAQIEVRSAGGGARCDES